MARQMIAFAAMAGQMIAFAAMAGQMITFAAMPATNVWVVDDYQTRASICRHIFMFLASACRCFAVVNCQAYRQADVYSKVSWRAMIKGEIYVECDSVVVCELLLGLRPWHLKSDYWYTIVCDCVGWRRCDEAGLAMMSLLVGRNRDKAICILAWQLTKVAAMAYIAIAHSKRLIESEVRASDIGTIILILHRLDGIDLRRWLAEVLLEIFVQRREKMNTRSTDGRRAGQTPYQLLAIK
ncbi:hypothetical protein Tco_1384334 [Tanacetum coccineum]